jgi:hypothetical protein
MVDLRLATGLEDCRHDMVSLLDHNTIQYSPGIPESFLRGCGVPEPVIASWREISPQRLVFDSCFISHSSVDAEFAHKLTGDLGSAGIKCWFAPHHVLPGKKLFDQIDQAIGVYDRLLLILSEASMASEWVKTEIANAREKEQQQERKILFPISIVPYEQVRQWRAFDADRHKDSAREIREYFIPDFTKWKDHDVYKAAFEQLLKGLKAD